VVSGRVITRISETLPKSLKKIFWSGNSRYCPLCESRVRKFLDHGIVPRADALCPVCGSLERHRFAWLFFTQETDLFNKQAKSMLHVAPEAVIERRLKQTLGSNYLSADLTNSRAMVRMDITDIKYSDGTFDIIYCSHVLEHVDDDGKAMHEFFRILKPEGLAVIQVPITVNKTFEDPSIMDPAERVRVFGQHDHVRCYGPDVQSRLANAGFKVRVREPNELMSADERQGMSIGDHERIFCCCKG
jgi:SAM-dependent methyltransferase